MQPPPLPRPLPGGVLVVDAHGLPRESLVSGLRAAGVEEVGAVASVPELLAAVRARRPGVVLLDGAMCPVDGEGGSPARWLVEEHPGCAVLVLSDRAGTDLAAHLLALRDPPRGVGLLLRDRVQDVSSLAESLRRVVAGEVVVDPVVVHELLRGRLRADPLSVLTDREREVLALVAQGWSNTAVARSTCLATKTVEKTITSINHKLGVTHHGHDADVNTRVLAVLAHLRSRPAPSP